MESNLKTSQNSKLKSLIINNNLINLFFFIILLTFVYVLIVYSYSNKIISSLLTPVTSDSKLSLWFSNLSNVKNNKSEIKIPIETKSTINPHAYKYKINPRFDICRNSTEILLIVCVLSSASNFANRNAIRSTWSNKTLFPNMRVVFLLGNSTNDLNEKIKSESDSYKDIVQEDFIDSYSNLSIKSIMGFKWAFNYCSKAKFYLKSDDDVIINSFYLLKKLNEMNVKIPLRDLENKLFCQYHVNARVIRDPNNKFYVPVAEYNNTSYETYCDGPAYLMTLNLAKNIFIMSLKIERFRFEDVYIGILANKMGVNFESWHHRYSNQDQIQGLIDNRNIGDKFFFYPCHQKDIFNLWSKMFIFFKSFSINKTPNTY